MGTRQPWGPVPPCVALRSVVLRTRPVFYLKRLQVLSFIMMKCALCGEQPFLPLCEGHLNSRCRWLTCDLVVP